MVTKLEGSPQPTMVHKIHTASFGFLFYRLLGLLLGTYKKDRAALSHGINHKIIGGFKKINRFLQINNVNPIPGPINIGLHFGIPPLGLMTEMNPGLQQLLHRNIRHTLPPFGFFRRFFNELSRFNSQSPQGLKKREILVNFIIVLEKVFSGKRKLYIGNVQD
jgi:hypothetical protein